MIEANLSDLNDAELAECEAMAKKYAHQWAGGYKEALDYFIRTSHDSELLSYQAPG